MDRKRLIHYIYAATLAISAAAIYTVSWWDAPYTLSAALTATAMTVAGGLLLYPVFGIAAGADEDTIFWLAVAGLILALVTYPLRAGAIAAAAAAAPGLLRHIVDCITFYLLGIPLAFLLLNAYIRIL
ncbi:MAG: hypothetical protein GXO15_01820 [Crenarchaeota archaeon]|nr:hypothetical protein [Thermoproteota archaeon]